MPQHEGVPAEQVHARAFLVHVIQQGCRPLRCHAHKPACPQSQETFLIPSSMHQLQALALSFEAASSPKNVMPGATYFVRLSDPHTCGHCVQLKA